MVHVTVIVVRLNYYFLRGWQRSKFKLRTCLEDLLIIYTDAELILLGELAVEKIQYHQFTNTPKYINIKLSNFALKMTE